MIDQIAIIIGESMLIFMASLAVFVSAGVYESWRADKLQESVDELYLDGTPEHSAWKRMVWEHRQEMEQIHMNLFKVWICMGLILLAVFKTIELVRWILK